MRFVCACTDTDTMIEQFEELNLTVNGVTTRVLKGGSGPDLLYWHGAGSGGSWQRHHSLLAEHYTVYSPDHPGWGGSDGPEWMDTMQDYVLHYESLISLLGIKRPALIGHSLGGWMAAEFAVTYPDAISALALVNAAGYPFDNENDLEEMPDFFAAAARGGPEFARLVFQKMDAAAAYFSAEPTAEDTLRRYRELTSVARIAWHCWYDSKLPRRLARITAPTLVLWGAYDRLIPPAFAHRYAEAIPGAKLIILEDCGHMVPMENPEAMVQGIRELGY